MLLLITQRICSRWTWKLLNRVSLTQTFNYQTVMRFHVLLVRHLYFLWKLHFMSSAAEKQHATKIIDAKCKFMQLFTRKPLLISAYRWRHTFLEISSCGKMQHAREKWSMRALFDVFGLSNIVSVKCTPYGLIITKVTLFQMDCTAMKGDYNQGIKARISVSKVIRT